jgi:galactonate dehydratase
VKITKIEIFHVKPRWSFLKMSTDEGVTGWGEAIVEGRSRTVAMAVKELEPHLIGQDPRRIEHLWQVMYRGTFYRGGPILSSAISGLEQAMWDILGKSLGVPVYQLLGGAVRDRIRIYCHTGGSTPEEAHNNGKKAVEAGFTFVKAGIPCPQRFLEPPAAVREAAEILEALRAGIGDNCDMGVDFHGRVGPALAIQIIKALEPIAKPTFVEEPVLPENVDALVTVARSTHIPIATGERLFTKWAFRSILEKQAAAILQPDLAHCGGILEGRKIAAMAETYFCAIAPHNPLGPINLAASLQLAACTPNFLCQEQVSLGDGYLKTPFVAKNGYIDLPTGPGLGIDIDEEAVLAKQYDGDWDTPRLFHEDDGSVADW